MTFPKASIQDGVLSFTSKGTQVCAFHRMEDYCICFVPISFWLACPFTVLTQKRQLENVTWTQKAEKVFIMLKGAFTSEQVMLGALGFSLLHLPKRHVKLLRVKAVISQEYLVIFIGQKLRSPIELEYWEAIGKKGLAIN